MTRFTPQLKHSKSTVFLHIKIDVLFLRLVLLEIMIVLIHFCKKNQNLSGNGSLRISDALLFMKRLKNPINYIKI